jgi:hypothetical protein
MKVVNNLISFEINLLKKVQKALPHVMRYNSNQTLFYHQYNFLLKILKNKNSHIK